MIFVLGLVVIPPTLAQDDSRHFLGNDGSTEDSVLASALGADPAGVRACTALLWPGSNVPTVPSTACGPSGDRWQ